MTAVDPATRTVTTSDGQTFTGDYLVVAAGSRPNFFHTPGAEEHAFPLYTVDDAKALRTRLFEVFEDADTDPARIDEGALNIVIVGAGPTGVETAGAVADLVNQVMPKRFHDLDVKRTRIYLVDHGPVVLAAFSEKAHDYAAGKLEHNGVILRLATGVSEVTPDRVTLSDGTRDPHPHRGLGGRHPGARAGRRDRPPARTRRPSDGRSRTWRSRASRASTPSATWRTSPTTTATTCRSSARSPSRPAVGRPTTSSPTTPASHGARSTTRTRGSWR